MTPIQTKTASATERWNDAILNDARSKGDDIVDSLAEGIINDVPFDKATGRLGYQQLLGIADLLLLAPELVLLKDSSITRALERMPTKYSDYFDPISVPSWVDEAKLARACTIWSENMLAIVGVLYASSLPLCYVIGNGIPALYQTGKLGQHRFIYQRIYETGLMLDAVMHPKGLHIFRDLPKNMGEHEERYVWGEGYIAARKVRMLHASLRTLLTKPHVLAKSLLNKPQNNFAASSLSALTYQPPANENNENNNPPFIKYDVEKLGLPVNQEDLAYTLLTFGLAIPEGLKAWGCRLSNDDCEAFLHAWLLVGHIMGIKAELLPDNYNSAKQLFAIISKRQIKATDMGKKLTRTLKFFLSEYLPPSMRRDVPFMLIETLLPPEQAAMIRPANTPVPSLRNIILVKSGFFVLRFYYLFKAIIVTRIPLAGKLLGSSFSIAGDALIDSWRDGFDCRPFYIPETATSGWRKKLVMNKTVRRALRAWRSDLFKTIFQGLLFIILSTISGAFLAFLTAVHSARHMDDWYNILLIGIGSALLTCMIGWIIGTYILTSCVKKAVARRPGPKEPGIAISK